MRSLQVKGRNLVLRVTADKTNEWHNTELSHQGLCILARMIARHHLEKGEIRRANEDTNDEVKSHRKGKIAEMDGGCQRL